MNTKICTSIEQSQELIKLGIDVSTADMWWNIDTVNKLNVLSCYNISDVDIPAWSLSALLGLAKEYMLEKYSMGKVMCHNDHTSRTFAKEPVDAVFEMVKKLDKT